MMRMWMLALANLFDTINIPPRRPFSMNKCISIFVNKSSSILVIISNASQDIPEHRKTYQAMRSNAQDQVHCDALIYFKIFQTHLRVVKH